MKRFPLHLLLALLAGLGLGLAYSWLIAPSQFTEANPSILRSDFKDQYRAVIAAAYASSHDLDRARARLGLLGDTDPVQALSAQAQQMLASGESFENVRLIAQLTSDIERGIASIPPVNTPTEIIITPAVSPTVISTDTLSSESTESPIQNVETPFAVTTSTPRPTPTPIPAVGKPFQLVGQDSVCDPDLPEGLLQVMLMDSRRRQVPGIEIIVTWNEGEDRFFTGFKPEVGDGYADFLMAEAVIYSVRVVQGGTTVPDIGIPICTDPNGQLYKGGILLTFQQP
jgi:hypothetical protein